jgi:hypothetical protein
MQVSPSGEVDDDVGGLGRGSCTGAVDIIHQHLVYSRACFPCLLLVPIGVNPTARHQTR